MMFSAFHRSRVLRTLCTVFCASIAALFAIGLNPALAIEKSPAPDNAKVYLISPQDGDTVPSTFAVKFGLSGMGIAPAGIDRPNTGHHHLLIDRAELPDLDTSFPSTASIRHFGGGQTETELTLAPGAHTLQLVLGNYAHVPHANPVISEKISVTVE